MSVQTSGGFSVHVMENPCTSPSTLWSLLVWMTVNAEPMKFLLFSVHTSVHRSYIGVELSTRYAAASSKKKTPLSTADAEVSLWTSIACWQKFLNLYRANVQSIFKPPNFIMLSVYYQQNTITWEQGSLAGKQHTETHQVPLVWCVQGISVLPLPKRMTLSAEWMTAARHAFV